MVRNIIFWKEIIDTNTKRLDLSEAVFSRLRGMTRDLNWPEDHRLTLRYDLEKLRASDDFVYATHNALHTFKSAQVNYDLIAEELEKFLVVLEEY